MKWSPKRGCWAQLQLSSCKDAHPPRVPDNTDICHTPCPSHTGELWHGGSGTLSLGQEHSAGRVQVQGAMLHSSAATVQEFHSVQKETHTHAHRGWARTWSPLCRRTRAGKVNAARLCIGLPVTDGAQVPLGRQTTASLGRATGKWWMLPSPRHIWNEIKTGREVGRYVGCSGRQLCVCFKSMLLGQVEKEETTQTESVSNVGNYIRGSHGHFTAIDQSQRVTFFFF